MAQGGIVNGPTRALIGEAGPEAIIPLRDMDKGARTSGGITINQYVSGSIWQTKELEALALGAVAKTQRGY
jgi:phage-related minor tail protein